MTDSSILRFELDPATLREADEHPEHGMVIFGTGAEPFDPDDFIVIEMPLAKFNNLGRPAGLTVAITARDLDTPTPPPPDPHTVADLTFGGCGDPSCPTGSAPVPSDP